LEIIIPYEVVEVVPEFGLLSVVVLGSGIGMVIYLSRNKNVINIIRN